MNDFAPLLRTLGRRLPLSEPARSKILLEMANDMDDLLGHYLDQGVGRDDALQAVEAHFDLSDDAVAELVRIHGSPVQRSLERLSARSTWEQVLLGLVGLLVAPGLVGHLAQPGLLADASLLAWLLLALLASGLGLGAWKAVALFGPAARSARPAPRKGIQALPALALAMLGLGFLGIWVELFRTALRLQAAPALALRPLVAWLQMASATLVVALSGALLTALVWFFLERRASALDLRAAASLVREES